MTWRGQLATFALGAAGAFTANVVSDDVGYKGLAVVVIFAAALSMANWVRRLPARSPAARYAATALLGLAAIAASAAMLLPRSWAIVALLSSAALTVGAALIPDDHAAAVQLLVGAAFIGSGIAVSRMALFALAEGDPRIGVALLFVSLAAVGFGFSGTRQQLLGLLVAAGVMGLAGAAAGAYALIRSGHLAFGIATIGAGLGLMVTLFGIAKERSPNNPVAFVILIASAIIAITGAVINDQGGLALGITAAIILAV